MQLKTRLPRTVYVFILAALSFIAYLLAEGMAVWAAFLYSLPIIFFYFAIANSAKDCRVNLNKTMLEIHYIANFWNPRIISIADIERLEFKKGESFWQVFFISNRYERNYRSRDKLILTSSTAQQEIMVNTNKDDLKVLINYFNSSKSDMEK